MIHRHIEYGCKYSTVLRTSSRNTICNMEALQATFHKSFQEIIQLSDKKGENTLNCLSGLNSWKTISKHQVKDVKTEIMTITILLLPPPIHHHPLPNATKSSSTPSVYVC